MVVLAGNGNPIECCEDDSTNAPPRYRHPACAPLKIDVKEEDYTRLPSCLNYVRSALNVNPNCTFGPAQQVSSVVLIRINGSTIRFKYEHESKCKCACKIKSQIENKKFDKIDKHRLTVK